MNGTFEISGSATDWKKRFSLYEDDIRKNYLFVQSLVSQVENLTNKNERLDKEVLGLLSTVRARERENALLNERLVNIDRAMEKSRFAAVILDGDGMVFSQELVSEGYEGGREAARQVVTFSRTCLKLSPATRLLVHVFANVGGLAYTLVQSGIVSRQEIFHEFVNGFNSLDELVTFTNVGRGKELTDAKISGLTKMYAGQPNCENIILGASHDNGYMRVLSKLETDGIAEGKVILLHGASFTPDLDRFDRALFPRVNFGELFMDKKMDVGKKYSQVAANNTSSTMGRKSISPMPTPIRLVEPELSVWLSVKNLNPRACNMFYLNPLKCSKSDCEYSHDHILSEVQLSALRYNCKKQLCRSFQQSDACPYNDDCIYGHECPDNVGGKCALGKKCKLMHPVGGNTH